MDEWKLSNYLTGSKGAFIYKNKLACFDLDGTLIKTKSGRAFSINSDDWIFYSENTIPKLELLAKNGWSIIIITNQSGLSKPDKINEWKSKIDKISQNIKIPFKLFCSISHDIYRKPLPTFYNLIIQNINVDESFYCGDACGRASDHSDCDYKFALNCGIKFVTPDEYFDKQNINLPKIIYPPFDEINKLMKNKIPVTVSKPENKELLLMVGPPGSGKSVFVTTKLVPLGYHRINRDTLGTVAKCLKECNKLCELGVNVVIDNINNDVATREKYISLFKKQGYIIRCLVMDVSIDTAMHNSGYRFVYGDTQSKHIPTIVYNLYKKKYTIPSLEEGFSEIIFVKPEIDKEKLDQKYYTLYMY